jgi:hypothetical protein
VTSVASRKQLFVAAFLCGLTVVAAVSGLLTSEPDDTAKRWIWFSTLAIASMMAAGVIVVAVARARWVAASVLGARRAAWLAGTAGTELGDRESLAELALWLPGSDQLVRDLIAADAYEAAFQVQQCAQQARELLPPEFERGHGRGISS